MNAWVSTRAFVHPIEEAPTGEEAPTMREADPEPGAGCPDTRKRACAFDPRLRAPPPKPNANALARLTPASGPQPRIPSGFGGCVGGFWAVARPQNPRYSPNYFWHPKSAHVQKRARFSSFKSETGNSGGLRPLRGRAAAAARPQTPPKTRPPSRQNQRGCGVGARFAGVKRASAFA